MSYINIKNYKDVNLKNLKNEKNSFKITFDKNGQFIVAKKKKLDFKSLVVHLS